MSRSFGKGGLEQRSIKTVQGRASSGPELTHSGLERQDFKDLFDIKWYRMNMGHCAVWIQIDYMTSGLGNHYVLNYWGLSWLCCSGKLQLNHPSWGVTTMNMTYKVCELRLDCMISGFSDYFGLCSSADGSSCISHFILFLESSSSSRCPALTHCNVSLLFLGSSEPTMPLRAQLFPQQI